MSAGGASVLVGVLVERTKAASPWIDFVWRPVSVLAGEPATPPWTQVSGDGERAAFYAGPAMVALHRSDTANYRDNLETATPLLWVVLRETGGEPPYTVFMVTADPSEGEGMTAAGNDIVDTVPMPDSIRDTVAAFVAEHHVEQVFVKRQRNRANPDALGRRPHTLARDDE